MHVHPPEGIGHPITIYFEEGYVIDDNPIRLYIVVVTAPQVPGPRVNIEHVLGYNADDAQAVALQRLWNRPQGVRDGEEVQIYISEIPSRLVDYDGDGHPLALYAVKPVPLGDQELADWMATHPVPTEHQEM
jgi:hypothetical protein